jgi:hypothetical protein
LKSESGNHNGHKGLLQSQAKRFWLRLFLCTTAVILLAITWGEAMNSKDPSPAKSAGPTAPKLSVKAILAQFWAAPAREIRQAAH